MRRTVIAACAAALLAGSGLTAFAQGGAGGAGGGGRRAGMQGRMMGGGMMAGGLQLLRMEEVQKELKMTQPQIDKLQSKQDEVRQAMQELRPANAGQGAQPDPAEMQKQMAKMREIQDKAVADVLDTTQLKRFKELELQRAGVASFQRKDVADALAISDDQKKKIQEVQRSSMEEFRNAMPQGGFQNMSQEERAELMKKMQDMRKATETKVLAVLTPQQQAKWKTMLGVEFKFPANQFGGGRRGGAGGPGGPGGPGGGAPPA